MVGFGKNNEFGCIPLNKGEQRDVDIINRAMKRLEARGIVFMCYDERITLYRGDENTPERYDDFAYDKIDFVPLSMEGLPVKEAEVAELDIVCQAG